MQPWHEGSDGAINILRHRFSEVRSQWREGETNERPILSMKSLSLSSK